MQRLTLISLAMALVPFSAALAGETVQHGSLKLEAPWSRATPPGAKVAAGYLTITNTGEAGDTLVSASSNIAERVELHEMTMDNGVMRMRALAGGVPIAGGATAELKPGGNHIMFMELKGPIKQGDQVKVTLTFEKAGAIDIMMPAAKIGAMSPDGAASHSGGQHGDGHHGGHGGGNGHGAAPK